MRTTRFLTLAALAAAVAWAADPAAAQPPARKKLQQLQKKIALEAKRAEEAKKAEEARKAEEKKPAAAKSADTGERAEPLKPAFIGGAKDAAGVARFIDQQIDARLAAEKVAPSPACTDAEFVRRVYLDITGVIPTAAEARAFLDDRAPDKRAKLIDQLLASPNYARHQADVWMGLLVQKTSDNRRVDFGPFRDWLAGEFAKNRPWNELVYDLITASGPQDKTPANGFYLSNNTVDKMTDEVLQVEPGRGEVGRQGAE
jgi:hypothetical protein